MSARDPIDRFVLYFYGAVIVMLFLGAIIIEKGEEVIFINGLHTPVLDKFFSWITYLGDGLVFVPIILLFAFYRYAYSAIALLALVLHGALSPFFKRVLFSDHMRPKELIENDLLYFVPGVDVHSNFSFPSGHTMTIFCAAFLIALVLRNRSVAVASLLVALLVGCSRIYLLQHFLIDVAGGALIGTLSAWFAWILFSRMKPVPWMERKLTLRS